jgi:hypothetical protein
VPAQENDRQPQKQRRKSQRQEEAFWNRVNRGWVAYWDERSQKEREERERLQQSSLPPEES